MKLTDKTFKIIIEHIDDIIIYQYSLKEKKMLYISPSLENILGYPAAAWLKSIDEIFALDLTNEWRKVLEKHQNNNIIEPFLIKINHSDGSQKLLEIKEEIIDDSYIVLGTAHDITAIEQLKIELETYTNNMQDLVKKRTQILWTLLKRNANLQDITHTIMESTQNLPTAIPLIADKINYSIPFTALRLILNEDNTNIFYIYTIWKTGDLEIQKLPKILLEDTELLKSIISHHPILNNDIKYTGQFRDDMLIKILQAKSILTVPILLQKRVLGTLSLFSSDKNNFSREDIDVLNQICMQIAAGLQNARLLKKLTHKAKDLEKANKELQQLDQLKNEFLARISHELRTPMTALLLALEIAQSDAKTPEYISIYTEAYREGQNLLELINTLLNFSKLESDKLPLELEKLDISFLFDDILNHIQNDLERKNLTITINKPDILPKIKVDYNYINQALLHLLDNAIKFTEKGGIYIDITENKTENKLMIKIKDTGIGISQKDKLHLFKKFHQIDGSYTRKYGGVGLGLAISKNLIETMNGTIEIHSDGINRGTMITILLPIDN